MKTPTHLSAEQLLAHHDGARLWDSPSGLDLARAYQQQLALRRLREQRGERVMGYKIGFTNRSIWSRYQVFEPVWGPVWDSGLVFCQGQGSLSLAATCQPRLEPECVFGLSHAPPPEPSLQQLWACIDWVAPGFEVVQSHLPNWCFGAADTVADGALHARLLVGQRQPAAALGTDAGTFEARLASASVGLWGDGALRERGCGALVLDGPLHALQHFVQSLRACPGAPDLQAGDLVTTGTWTDAWPVLPGQTWQARFEGALSALQVTFH